ncbi:hypothetical protein EI94DRAFT_1696124 [Lactarius quietus]|nr:hypothetical protein EI94DRAFT_1696124 [Lactarius quietus]
MKADIVILLFSWYCHYSFCLCNFLLNEVFDVLVQLIHPPTKAEELEYVFGLTEVFLGLFFILHHVWSALMIYLSGEKCTRQKQLLGAPHTLCLADLSMTWSSLPPSILPLICLEFDLVPRNCDMFFNNAHRINVDKQFYIGKSVPSKSYRKHNFVSKVSSVVPVLHPEPLPFQRNPVTGPFIVFGASAM